MQRSESRQGVMTAPRGADNRQRRVRTVIRSQTAKNNCFIFMDAKLKLTEKQQAIVDAISINVALTQKEVLTTDEAAKYLGISKSSLYKMTMARKIPYYKSPTGKLCFFNRVEVEAWMQRYRVATSDEIHDRALDYCARTGNKKGGTKL